MKTTSTLLLALALGHSSISTASAGLITDPLSVQAPIHDGGLATDPHGVKGPIVDQGITTDALGFQGPVIGQGIISDTLGFKDGAPKPHLPFDGGDGPDYLVGSDAADSFDGGDGPDYLVGSDAADSFDGGDGSDFVYKMINLAIDSAGGIPLKLQDLFALPGVFDALHAKGPAADELRGYVDWLMMTGIILGGGGGDVIMKGPGSDRHALLDEGPAPTGELTSVQALGFSEGVSNMSFSFGSTQAFHRPAAPTDGIILGGPGGDTIILGGPGGDTFLPSGAFHIPPTLK